MKNIYLLFHIVIWDGRTKNLAKLQGKGRMVRKKLTPKSDRVTLYAFAEVAYKFRTVVWQLRKQMPISLKEVLRPSTNGFDDIRYACCQ